MIKFEKGRFTAEGIGAEIMMEFSLIVKSLYKYMTNLGMDEDFVKGKLEKHFGFGFLPEEEEMAKAFKELREESIKSSKHLNKGLIELPLELLEEMEGEENGSK